MSRCEVTRVISIDMLSDDVLLAVFDFCACDNPLIFVARHETEAWHSLVHVCQRWRSIVFASPRRLNLWLFCSSVTPTDALDVWPALPFLILEYHFISAFTGTTSVHHSPHRSFPLGYSSFWVHLTRGNGRCPLRGDQPGIASPSIPISSISP